MHKGEIVFHVKLGTGFITLNGVHGMVEIETLSPPRGVFWTISSSQLRIKLQSPVRKCTLATIWPPNQNWEI